MEICKLGKCLFHRFKTATQVQVEHDHLLNDARILQHKKNHLKSHFHQNLRIVCFNHLNHWNCSTRRDLIQQNQNKKLNRHQHLYYLLKLQYRIRLLQHNSKCYRGRRLLFCLIKAQKRKGRKRKRKNLIRLVVTNVFSMNGASKSSWKLHKVVNWTLTGLTNGVSWLTRQTKSKQCKWSDLITNFE